MGNGKGSHDDDDDDLNGSRSKMFSICLYPVKVQTCSRSPYQENFNLPPFTQFNDESVQQSMCMHSRSLKGRKNRNSSSSCIITKTSKLTRVVSENARPTTIYGGVCPGKRRLLSCRESKTADLPGLAEVRRQTEEELSQLAEHIGSSHLEPCWTDLRCDWTKRTGRGALDGDDSALCEEDSHDLVSTDPLGRTYPTPKNRIQLCPGPRNEYVGPPQQRLRPSQRKEVWRSPPLVLHCQPDRFITPRKAFNIMRDHYLVRGPHSFEGKLCEHGSVERNPLGPRSRQDESSYRSSTLSLVHAFHSLRTMTSSIFYTGTQGGLDDHERPFDGSLITALARTPQRTVPITTLGGQNIAAAPRARVYRAAFLRDNYGAQKHELYRDQLALAFQFDRRAKIMKKSRTEDRLSSFSTSFQEWPAKFSGEWLRRTRTCLLEAPDLRDDYYCSVLAYSKDADSLAVGLNDRVYLWSEALGVVNPPHAMAMASQRAGYVSSLAFSSDQGRRAILAVGRATGLVTLYSPLDEEPRILKIRSQFPAVLVSFRPAVLRLPCQRQQTRTCEQEMLLVGDDAGVISLYMIDWPTRKDRDLYDWSGGISLYSRVAAHTQQICGISWSVQGDVFCTGGNDNLCCLFDLRDILAERGPQDPDRVHHYRDSNGNNYTVMDTLSPEDTSLGAIEAKHQWRLNAAVKALALCPWQHSLLAAGGGSNDRCIHFFHTATGAALATIDCAAQITSLIWSSSRHEIAASFGFAQPEHPYRIAVFAWPSCQQVVVIPWQDESRALYAIPYPRGPSYGCRRQNHSSCTSQRMQNEQNSSEEGCIVVAGSDHCVRFHEVWRGPRQQSIIGRQGLLGSDILEGMHGIEKSGIENIR